MILSAAYLARMAFSQGVSPCIVAHPLSPRATTAAIITRFIIASLLLLEFTIRPALGQTGERFDSFDLLTQLIHNRDRSLGNLIHRQLARASIRGIQPNQLANLANKHKPTCCIIRNQSTPSIHTSNQKTNETQNTRGFKPQQNRNRVMKGQNESDWE